MNEASLSTLAKFNCLAAIFFDCLDKNCEGNPSFHSVQSPSLALLFINPNFFLPSLSVYQYCPPISASLIAEPNGLSGSFFISFKTSNFLGHFSLVLLVLNTRSYPSGISSE